MVAEEEEEEEAEGCRTWRKCRVSTAIPCSVPVEMATEAMRSMGMGGGGGGMPGESECRCFTD